MSKRKAPIPEDLQSNVAAAFKLCNEQRERIAKLEDTISKRESLLDKFNASNESLTAKVEKLKAANKVLLEALNETVSDEALLGLNEKYGYFQFNDAQGAVSRAFADDIVGIIRARAAIAQAKH